MRYDGINYEFSTKFLDLGRGIQFKTAKMRSNLINMSKRRRLY